MPEFSKRPDITIINNFSKSTNQLTEEFKKKLIEKYFINK